MAGIDECVITVDLLTDGVDFILAETDPRRIGRKALAVNLSDLAAMAAQPLAAVLAVALPRQGARELAVQLYEGLLPLAEEFNLAIAGGDTNSWDGPLVITATLLGQVTASGALRREGRGRATGSSSRGPSAAAFRPPFRLPTTGRRGVAVERTLRASCRHGRQRRAGAGPFATGGGKRCGRDR